MPELHAFLSASASKRWIECPPSAMACSGIPDEPSVFALQGTDCHELCAYKVEKALGKKVVFVNLKLCHFQWKFQLKIVPVFYYAPSVMVTQKEVERR